MNRVRAEAEKNINNAAENRFTSLNTHYPLLTTQKKMNKSVIKKGKLKEQGNDFL